MFRNRVSRWPISLWLAPLTIGLLLVAGAVRALPAGPHSCDPGVLTPITVDASRAHRVGPGAVTTYVYLLRNPGTQSASGSIAVTDQSNDWSATLAFGDEAFQSLGPGTAVLGIDDLAPGEARSVILSVSSPVDAADGTPGAASLAATLDNGHEGCGNSTALVSSHAKVFFLGVDGFSPAYVTLGTDGEPNPGPDELLMPRLQGFLTGSASFPGARDSLLSATDMNVFGVLSGSWPGTLGMNSVGVYFYGWNQQNQPVYRYRNPDDIRYGPDGERVQSIFDVAKDPALGGDLAAFTAMVSGKWQMWHLFADDSHSVPDIMANGERFPPYLGVPATYVLGDPASDANAATDRDGVNIWPYSEFHLHAQGLGLSGDEPGHHPSDAWVMRGALRILAAEDPDVLVVHLGNLDHIQHAAGGASFPAEWRNRGTPATLWDDVNIYNAKANREPILDVVHEVDTLAGLFFDALATRQVLDASIVTLYSDHGGNTYLPVPVDLNQILADGGFGPAVRSAASFAEVASVYLWDGADAEAVAGYLENWQYWHPTFNAYVQPLVAITRSEMAVSMDSVLGPFGRVGAPGRAELYSQWLIDHPVPDNSKVIWQDLMVLTRHRVQFTHGNLYEDVVGGHGGRATMPVLLAIKGPGVQDGVYTGQDVSLVDAIPTIYYLQGWTSPGNVDGRVLSELLAEP